MITTTVGLDADDKPIVVDLHATEPDLKMLAIEQFKIQAQRYWTAL